MVTLMLPYFSSSCSIFLSSTPGRLVLGIVRRYCIMTIFCRDLLHFMQRLSFVVKIFQQNITSQGSSFLFLLLLESLKIK